MGCEGVRHWRPRIIGVESVKTPDVGSCVRNALCRRVKDDARCEAASAAEFDVLPGESSLDGSGCRSDEVKSPVQTHFRSR